MAKKTPNDTPQDAPEPPAEPTQAADPALAAASTHTGAKRIAAEENGHEAPAAPAPDAPSVHAGYADYTMPDDYAGEDFLTKARNWVERHPALAVAGAVGLGLAVGRLVAAAVPEPEPETLKDRARARAGDLSKDIERLTRSAKKQARVASKQAKGFAAGAGDSVQDKLARAAEALEDVQASVSEAAHDGVEKTKDLADVIGEAVKAAVAGVVVKKADDWIGKIKG